jgi:hypothetical protein
MDAYLTWDKTLTWQQVIEYTYISHHNPEHEVKYKYALKIANKILKIAKKKPIDMLIKFKYVENNKIRPENNKLYRKCMKRLGTPVKKAENDISDMETRRERLLTGFNMLLMDFGYKLMSRELKGVLFYNIVKKNKKKVY